MTEYFPILRSLINASRPTISPLFRILIFSSVKSLYYLVFLSKLFSSSFSYTFSNIKCFTIQNSPSLIIKKLSTFWPSLKIKSFLENWIWLKSPAIFFKSKYDSSENSGSCDKWVTNYCTSSF